MLALFPSGLPREISPLRLQHVVRIRFISNLAHQAFVEQGSKFVEFAIRLEALCTPHMARTKNPYKSHLRQTKLRTDMSVVRPASCSPPPR